MFIIAVRYISTCFLNDIHKNYLQVQKMDYTIKLSKIRHAV